ncbi:MAG: glycogen-binding domain-containing protein [Verrucomicrobiota bacterium]
MNTEDKTLERLAKHRTKAPEGFADRVMAALPDRSRPTLRERVADFWPTHGRWIAPAFAGAAATLLVVFGMGRLDRPVEAGQVSFHFELHAPGADRVELLGTFNEWKSGDIVLNGPDASGHWTAEVALPEGRHEYIFLVDGERWIADPKAATHRPDGFGRVNTVIKVYEEDPV